MKCLFTANKKKKLWVAQIRRRHFHRRVIADLQTLGLRQFAPLFIVFPINIHEFWPTIYWPTTPHFRMHEIPSFAKSSNNFNQAHFE